MSSIQEICKNHQNNSTNTELDKIDKIKLNLYTRAHRSGKTYSYKPPVVRSRKTPVSSTIIQKNTHPQLRESTEFLLVRHGETDWNKQKLYLGQTNISLNETGIKQAKKLARYLVEKHPDITAIYSSDLARASATAQHVARVFNVKVNQRSTLQEISWGEVEGSNVDETDKAYSQKLEDLKKTYPGRKERWAHEPVFPKGETYNTLLLRVKNELKHIASAHPGEKIAVFAHGRILRTLVSESMDHADVYPQLPNCAIVQLRFTPEKSDCPFTCLKIEEPSH